MRYAYGGNTEKALYWLDKANIRKDAENEFTAW